MCVVKVLRVSCGNKFPEAFCVLTFPILVSHGNVITALNNTLE